MWQPAPHSPPESGLLTETLDLPRPDVPATPVAAATVEDPAQPVGPGYRLRNRYLLDRQIGSGGFSLVFRAVDLVRQTAGSPDPFVAVKVLRDEHRASPDAVARLQREFARLEAVAHPNVCRVCDLDADGDTWFIVMELLEGESLAALLGRPQPVLRDLALSIVQASGAALRHAHEQGVVHGDFKPGNVVLTQAEEVRVIDFGAGSDVGGFGPADASAAMQTARRGTPAYASPETLRGESPDVRDDVFSFAVVVYELLCGHRPFGPYTSLTASEHGHLPAQPAQVSTHQWQLLARALSFDRNERLGSVESLCAAFAPRPRRSPHAFVTGATALCTGLALGFGFGPTATVPGNEPQAASPPSSSAAPPSVTGGAAAAAPLQAHEPHAGVQPAAASPTSHREAPVATDPVAPVVAAAPMPQTWLSLDQQSLRVTHATSTVAMLVKRGEGPARRARIHWKTIPGTARPGIDYEAVEQGVVDIAENQQISSLYVPLLRSDVAGERSFDIEIAPATRNVSVGPFSRVRVTIGSTP